MMIVRKKCVILDKITSMNYLNEFVIFVLQRKGSFYQKITDIYATSVDYDSKAEITKEFFATVQNKLHFAIYGQTAAELIVESLGTNFTSLFN